MTSGYVAINASGQYGYIADKSGFSTEKCIKWTDDINQADLFPSDKGSCPSMRLDFSEVVVHAFAVCERVVKLSVEPF